MKQNLSMNPQLLEEKGCTLVLEFTLYEMKKAFAGVHKEETIFAMRW